jgi:hypothetical protein
METARWAAASSRSDCTTGLATVGLPLGADWLEGPDAQGRVVAHSAEGQWGHW